VLGIQFPEFVLLVVAALFVFGPDRLPSIAAQAARLLRQLRETSSGVRAELREVVGPELADLDLTSLDPRRAVSRALLDVDDDRPTPPAPRPAPLPSTDAPPPFDADAT